MTKDEALKLALEAMEYADACLKKQLTMKYKHEYAQDLLLEAGTAIKEALTNEALEKMAENARELGLDYEPAKPFITHNVEKPYDWSEWVCPDPKNYLMKCCDCGLVHEAEFGVVRYKSETEREDCDMVDDPNLQAVFRMRRSEEWSPEDTAHRSGGLPMAQPEQKPVAYDKTEMNCFVQDLYDKKMQEGKHGHYETMFHVVHQAIKRVPPQRTWVGLTAEQMRECNMDGDFMVDRETAKLNVQTKLKELNT